MEEAMDLYTSYTTTNHCKLCDDKLRTPPFVLLAHHVITRVIDCD